MLKVNAAFSRQAAATFFPQLELEREATAIKMCGSIISGFGRK
jgi:hypothetical protein